MTAARPLSRLLLLPSPRRALSTTPFLSHRGPSRDYPILNKPLTADSAPYTPADLAELRKRYSPSQIASFLAGETSISRSDFESRVARPRGDPMGLHYLDDLSMYDPVLDFPDPAHPPEYVIGHPLQPLPVLSDPVSNDDTNDSSSSSSSKETAPWMRSVSRKTGFSEEQLGRFRHRVLVSHRVVNMTHMGKISKIYSLVVAGNGNGLVGIGEGKATEFEDSQRMATYVAMRNLEPIPRYEGRTIFGDVEVKVGAVELGLYSRPPGFGVRCSQYVFEIARCLGIQDLSARATRSRNPMNVIKATMHALRSQRLPETIARGRGKKFVDVRKVYYNGMV